MASTGVTFRTGPRTSAGERVASGLVLTLGKFDCVIDNASCFAGTSFPANGTVLLFGDLHIYIATVPKRFPREIVSVAGPPCSSGGTSAAPRGVEVMMAGSSSQPRRPRERGVDEVRTSAPPQPRNPVEDAIDRLLTPVNLGDNPEEAEANFTMERQILLQEAMELAAARKQLEITRREYDHAHGLTPATAEPSRRG